MTRQVEQKKKTQKMERMERFQRAQRRIAADVEEQSNVGKKNAKHTVKHATYLCLKPNHFVCRFKNKPAAG